MPELSEDFLIKAGSYAVFQQARLLVASGKVADAKWTPPLLRGKITEGRKVWAAGLKITGPGQVEVLCLCPEARRQGKVCVHAVAVGLAALAPQTAEPSAKMSAPLEPLRPTTAPPGNRRPTTETPEVRLEIEGSLRHLDAKLTFSYPQPDTENSSFESAIFEELAQAGFVGRYTPSGWIGTLKDEQEILRCFAEELPQWEKTWRVRRGERFTQVTKSLIPITPSFAFEPSISEDWLNFRLHFQAGAQAVLSYDEVRRLLSSGRKSIELRGGKKAIIPPNLLEEISEVLHEVNPERLSADGPWKIHHQQAEYLRSTLTDHPGAPADPIPPPTLQEGITLRPYQLAGFTWLAGLARRGLGGLLADDMGLGKTLQALALLASRPGPHLVVCPASLVWNWTREARRFFPSLRVLPLVGTDRSALLAQLPDCDLALTSYGLLRRDQDGLAAQPWEVVLLDEAQHIKNPSSQNARAARRLKARARFVLSGTPLENSLRDLWSLYAFALPGYLGSAEEFQQRYELPLRSAPPEERRRLTKRLRRRIGPYFLRREKAEVLPELPARLEQVLEVELTPRQKALYDQVQAQARSELDRLEQPTSAGTARLRILAALLRLRQICCDTRLLGDAGETATSPDEEALPTSAKLSALMELLGEALEGNHRVLVFSQFTALLDLVEPLLQSREVGFLRLDGSTRDRAAVVDNFQAPNGPPVFLLSLKAGGAGLNLTAADTVIHLDPWWNPAVEAQAIDRAHRFGQTRCVTSIKLIARSTVEEKVLRLQAEKRELFASAIDAEAAWEGLNEREMADLLRD